MGNVPIDDRNNYIWDKAANSLSSWSDPYRVVFQANVILQELPKIAEKNSIPTEKYNIINGQALFFRSFAFYHLAQLYCRPYSTTAANDAGIPLKLIPDIEAPSTRATLQETYDRIILDLKEAVKCLPVINVAINRPNKPAAYAALARTYFIHERLYKRGLYADSCLKINDDLIDFNTLDSIAAKPIDVFNLETIFYASGNYPSIPNPTTVIDTTLYNSYNDGDLRKIILFSAGGNGGAVFKGCPHERYDGFAPFYGLANNELYLTRAECSARAGVKGFRYG